MPLLSSRFIPTSWEFISTERNRETVDEARTLLESGGFRVVENRTQNASLTATGFLHTLSSASTVLLQSGGKVDEIDAAMPCAPMGLGPFLTADMLGIDRVMRLDGLSGSILNSDALKLITRLQLKERSGVTVRKGYYEYGEQPSRKPKRPERGTNLE